MTLDWRTGKWLDGPRTADWLEAWLKRQGEVKGLRALDGGVSTTRTIYRWRHENAIPSVYTLDRILTRFGAHISEIPDDLWLVKRPPYTAGRRVAEAEKRAAVRMAETRRIGEVANHFGVTEKSIRNWKKKVAA